MTYTLLRKSFFVCHSFGNQKRLGYLYFLILLRFASFRRHARLLLEVVARSQLIANLLCLSIVMQCRKLDYLQIKIKGKPAVQSPTITYPLKIRYVEIDYFSSLMYPLFTISHHI